MPLLNILTNLPKNQIPKNFVEKIIPTLARAVKKPEEKFICVISGDASINILGDSATPAAVARLESIGNLGPEQNVIITRQISDFVQQELGISPNRFFITMYDLEDYQVGIRGTTVEKLESAL